MGTYRYTRIAMIAVLLAAGLGFFALKAPPAGASSEVCQAARNLTWVCIDVHGRGGYVADVWGKGSLPTVPSSFHDLSQVGKVCDYVTKVRISGNGNTHYRDYEDRAPKGQCAVAGAYNIVRIN